MSACLQSTVSSYNDTTTTKNNHSVDPVFTW